MSYFILPTCNIAFNAKVGSSTLAYAIVKHFYPEIEAKIVSDHRAQLSQFSADFIKTLPKSFTNHALDSLGVWQRICPQTKTPNKIVLLPIRDPVERFRSSITQFAFDADQALDALENGTEILWGETLIRPSSNIHFNFQNKLIIAGKTKFYMFPKQFNQLANDAGLPLPLPTMNKTEHKKPVLTREQINRINLYYAEDVILYDMVG
jgi:hypothetical protein